MASLILEGAIGGLIEGITDLNDLKNIEKELKKKSKLYKSTLSLKESSKLLYGRDIFKGNG